MAQLKQVMKGPNEIVSFDHPFIHYPQYASQKFDGFRMLNLCGERLLSPALKDFPNQNMAVHFDRLLTYCKTYRYVTDGEIWSPKLTFQELQSIIRSHDKPIPEHVGYYIFDMMEEWHWDNENEPPFVQRFINYQSLLQGFPNVFLVNQHRVTSAAMASELFDSEIAAGHEGIVLRALDGRYKHGRTTLKQDGMWKFKEFVTHDAVIIGVEEQMRLKAGVERTTNEIGHLERRYEQALYEPAGMVGAFIVEHNGQQFKVKPGKGWDNGEKIRTWQNYISSKGINCIGRHIEYKFMPHGTMDKPRIGSLVRFRPDLD